MGVESIIRWDWRDGRNYILRVDSTVPCTALPRQQLVPYSLGTAALLSYAGAAPKIVATNLQLVFIKLQIEQQQKSSRRAEKRIKKRKNNQKVFLPFAAWSVFPFCRSKFCYCCCCCTEVVSFIKNANRKPQSSQMEMRTSCCKWI